MAVTGRKRTLFHCKWANSISYISRMLYWNHSRFCVLLWIIELHAAVNFIATALVIAVGISITSPTLMFVFYLCQDHGWRRLALLLSGLQTTKVHCIEWVCQGKWACTKSYNNSTPRPRASAGFFYKPINWQWRSRGLFGLKWIISTTESGCGLVKSRCVLGNIDENIPHPCHFAVKSSLTFWMDVCDCGMPFLALAMRGVSIFFVLVTVHGN